MSIYNIGNWERIEEVLKELMEEKRNEYVIIGGGFNIKIGEEGGQEELGGEMNRK